MGAMTPKFELGRDLCTMQFSLSFKFHHPMFTRSEVIVLTNKQRNKRTPLKTSKALRYATTLGKKRWNRASSVTIQHVYLLHKCTTSIPWTVKLNWLENAYSHPLLSVGDFDL